MEWVLPWSWWAASCLILIGLLLYFLLTPMDRFKDVSDLGFSFPESRGQSKREVERQCARTRRVGNPPPPYPNGWVPVTESRRLSRGQVHYCTAVGENLAVFRGESGEVHVLDAYCSHLGANMAIGGKVRGDCLECPFHAWRFSGHDGHCTSIPYSDKVPDCAKVRRWETVEQYGLVLVWYHAEGLPPSWTPPPEPDGVSVASLCSAGRAEYRFSCHAQEIGENSVDEAHIEPVHGSRILGGAGHQAGEIDWWPSADHPHLAHLRATVSIGLFGAVNLPEITITGFMIGPYIMYFTTRTFLGPMFMVEFLTPQAPRLLKVVLALYRGRLALIPFAKIFGLMTANLFQMDAPIWNHKMYNDKPNLLKEERKILRFRRWYAQFYSKSSID